jgi:hypothetical protein
MLRFHPGVTVSTLKLIISNLLSPPNEPKYKKLPLSNASFQLKVARLPAAIDFLKVLGFIEQDRALTYIRNDPGLLWLGKSHLDSLLSSN